MRQQDIAVVYTVCQVVCTMPKIDQMPQSIPSYMFQAFVRYTYYGFGLGLDTRDSNAYVSRAKRTRCYAETVTFPRANFLERK